jgi:hypothetical protein
MMTGTSGHHALITLQHCGFELRMPCDDDDDDDNDSGQPQCVPRTNWTGMPICYALLLGTPM